MVRSSLLGATHQAGKFTQGFSDAKRLQERWASFQTGDSSVLGKGKKRLLVETRCEAIGKETVLLNIEVKELNRASGTTRKSKKMDRCMDTFIQPSKQLLRGARTALMK